MMKKTDTGRRWPLSAAMSALALAMSGCAVLDLPAETSQTVAEIESAEGVAISYAASGEGETTLVFIHGWSCDRSYWRNQVDLFDDAYRVIAVDLAGHGASGSDRETWSMEAFGADVAAAARADDAQRVVLVGHSMGGPVMLETARLLGDRVVAMIGVDTLQTPDSGVSRDEAEAAWAPLAADFQNGVRAWVGGELFPADADPTLMEQITADMASAPQETAVASGIEFSTYDSGAALSDTAGIPLALINATLVPTDMKAHKTLRGDDFTLEIIEGVGHFPMLEAPDKFNEALTTALARLED